jgi:hypothetical protein
MAGASYDRPTDGDLITNASFGGTNPTPGTGIAQSINATFDETRPLAVLRNMSGKALNDGGKLIIPRYLRLICTVAPASGTDAHLVVASDDTNRYTSGGSNIVVAGSRSDMLAQAGIGRFDFGAIVAPAAGANRKFVTRKVLKRAAVVVGDEFLIIFNDPDDSVNPTLTGATAQIITCTTDSLALAPGVVNHSMVFNVWFAGNAVTPASWELEVGWIEKSA